MAVPADPTNLHPMPEQPRVVLLRPLVTSPLIEVGQYSHNDDPDDATAFETRNDLVTDAEVARRAALLRVGAPAEGGTMRAADLIEHALA